MTQRTTTHLPGVVQGYEISRALCRSGGGEIVTRDPSCTLCRNLYRMGNPMVDKALAARLATPNPLNLPTVVIFHDKGAPPAKILQLFDERLPLRVIHERAKWSVTDFVVQETALTPMRERFAARHNALIVVLPEASTYLSDQIAGRTMAGEDVHLFLAYQGCEADR